MKKLIIAFLICGLATVAYSQKASASKTEKIKQLLELSGSGKLGEQMAKSVIALYQKSHTDVPQDFWDDLSKKIYAEDLINLIMPIYDKYYTEEDIDQLINFYKTPIGKKMIEILPMLMQESMAAGQTWGKELAEKVTKELKEKGY